MRGHHRLHRLAARPTHVLIPLSARRTLPLPKLLARGFTNVRQRRAASRDSPDILLQGRKQRSRRLKSS
ncbi:hypothetical protein SFOMI_1233 [Sphingobium fuliginis]|uniref:Uncharacterized protein n=1 Tax=Sphingobium fuliginis (strain ATCC 27551) TaxID=336203 RepID=A0A292ZCZ1_SPHSA|nr:hypothetical protein SFOMI_1233 [Sphingobium fuliginis]